MTAVRTPQREGWGVGRVYVCALGVLVKSDVKLVFRYVSRSQVGRRGAGGG